MSKQRDIEDHLHALEEIAGIFGAMKNFALMETQKLTRFASTQRRVVEGIEMTAADFLTFYPAGTQRLDSGKSVYLLIGSERGMCGISTRLSTIVSRGSSMMPRTSRMT
jgi:F0F1-type ATP synthase gamma subunit